MLQRIIKGVLSKEREIVEALHTAFDEWRNVAPTVAAAYAESRHIIVIDTENFLDRELDAVCICITALDPRRCENVQLIRRRGVLSNERLQKYVISHHSMCENIGGYRENQHQRESAWASHSRLQGHVGGRLPGRLRCPRDRRAASRNATSAKT